MSDSSGTIEASALPAAALSTFDATAYLEVDERELRILMKQKALPLILAAIFCGLFFGTALQAGDALFGALSDGAAIAAGDLFYVMVACFSLGIGGSAVVVSLTRRWQVLQALDAIRKRSQNRGKRR